MSIVKYKNKKTGAIAVYESTSHYDPETRQSRPIRKYLGMEDPETGELIPSSGKRGRKQSEGQKRISVTKHENTPDYRLLYETLKREVEEKDRKIVSLENKNMMLHRRLKHIYELLTDVMQFSGIKSDS